MGEYGETSEFAKGLILPSWAKQRPGWCYVGWLHRTGGAIPFEEQVEKAKQSDHGELRAVDIYPEGGVCWVKNAS